MPPCMSAADRDNNTITAITTIVPPHSSPPITPTSPPPSAYGMTTSAPTERSIAVQLGGKDISRLSNA